jgi:hypothetical protein
MSDAVMTLNGHACTKAVLHIPGIGPWFVDCDLADEAEGLVSGKATFAVGDSKWQGTIDPRHAGTFGLQRKLRLIAGGGGWGSTLAPHDYHNDAGVKALNVAQDAAREAGEVLGDFAVTDVRLGSDYLRTAGPASRALEHAIRGTAWWVGADGVTRVGPRAQTPARAGSYDVQGMDPRARVVTLALDDISAVGIGSIISDRLDAPATVRELTITIDANAIRAEAWVGEGAQGNLVDTLRAVVERMTDSRLHGIYRYRVVAMAGDRVNLQVIRKRIGVPDAATIPMWPGVSGSHATLTAGTEVTVQFLDGDPSSPIITGFVGRGGPGDVPQRLELGGSPASDAARKGDSVECPLPPAVFSGTVGGAPATGVLTFPMMKLVGVITGGSSKVGVAT